jgi:hypothetical protein
MAELLDLMILVLLWLSIVAIAVAIVVGHIGFLTSLLVVMALLVTALVCTRWWVFLCKLSRRSDIVIGSKKQFNSTPEATTDWIFNNLPHLYRTPGHEDIFTLFLSLCRGLRGGNYVKKNGVATRVLVGAKGIGKTVSCRRFLDVGPTIFSELIMVYVNCEEISDSNHVLRRVSLSAAILAKIVPWWNILDILLCSSGSHALLDWLQRKNKRMIIIVDELDELYKLGCHDKSIPHATLGNLQAFGNSVLGAVSVVACGSSATLQALIAQNLTDDIIREFPVSHGAPNLNGTKFSAVRVSASTPVALEILQSMFPGEAIEKLRRCLYFSGTNVREVLKFIDDCQVVSVLDSGYSSKTVSLDPVRVRRRAFLMAILDKLCDLNIKLVKTLDQVTKNGTLLDFIGQTQWELSFVSIPTQQAIKIWSSLPDQGKMSRTEKDEMMSDLWHLSDRQYLVVTPEEIFPSSVHLLMCRHELKEESQHYRSIFASFGRALTTLLPAVTKAAAAAF